MENLYCKSRFTLPLTSWLSWDDLFNLTYSALNLSIIVLTTVNTIKIINKDISEEESKRIVFSQKIIRIVAGSLIFIMGFANIIIYFTIVPFSASNRIIQGITQMSMGIVYLILSTYIIQNVDVKS